ncbi:MAG: F0F1 ATP synthase subunit gamma [Paludibacteraceae bacterium]|nr:F0F1 ATP synthase subunit gamma [Paludibacteraceae bacterium]
MASLKEIRARILSVNSTKKITSAMKWYRRLNCISRKKTPCVLFRTSKS